MKKLTLSIIVFVFVIFSGWCEFFDIVPQSPQFTLTQGGYYNFVKDNKNESMGMRTIASVDMKSIYTDVGLNVQGDYIDVATNVIFWPQFFGYLKFGPAVSYHVAIKPEVFCDSDFIFKICFAFTAGWFSETTSVGYFHKYTQFLGKSSQLPDLHDDSVFFDNKFTLQFPSGYAIFTNFSTVSYFEYPLFLCPFFDFGFEAPLRKNVSFRLSVFTKWIDMFIVSISPSNIGIDTCVQVRI